MNPIYQFTVPVFAKSLKALDGLLTKAEEAVTAGKFTEDALLNDRLAPDMFPLIKQVQVACDNAKGACARLSGSEIASHPDDEKTLAELHVRIAKTLEIVNATTEESFADAATRKITISYFPGVYMTGFDYAREYALPNFFFHVTTAYDIMRKMGMEIGKVDFMGGLPFNALET